MSKQIVIIAIIAAGVMVLMAIGGAVIILVDFQKEKTMIQSFQECVAAGNPVLETYPPQCKSGGRTFTKVEPPVQPPATAPVEIESQFPGKIVYKSTPQVTLKVLRSDCISRHGTFNECGSVCATDAESCVMMCAFTCENLP